MGGDKDRGQGELIEPGLWRRAEGRDLAGAVDGESEAGRITSISKSLWSSLHLPGCSDLRVSQGFSCPHPDPSGGFSFDIAPGVRGLTRAVTSE